MDLVSYCFFRFRFWSLLRRVVLFLFYNVSGLTIFSVRVSGLGFVFLCSKFVGRRDINVVGCYSVFLGNILVLECFRESWF